MQSGKTRSASSSSDAPQRTSPSTPRSSRVARTGGNDSDSPGIMTSRTPTERSPKVVDRRSPRSPAAAVEKKRPNRLPELEAQVAQLQEELKKAKDQLSSSEMLKRRMQDEVEDAKRQLKEMAELRVASQERDTAWQLELEAVQKQQSMDAEALSSAVADSLQDIISKNAEIAELKTRLVDAEKAMAAAQEEADNCKLQLETAKASVNTLCAEGVQLRECLNMKDTELEEAIARIGMLEDVVMKLQQSENGGEMEQLRSALEAAELKHQEEMMQKTVELRSVYDLLKNTTESSELKILALEDELRKKNAADADAELAMPRLDGIQTQLELQLMKSVADIAELKADLKGLSEEKDNLRSETVKKETELELAKAAEQEARMRLGFVTEEADKSSRRVARLSEQLEAAETAGAEMEAELRRLRVQSDQWRKAAEAAAAALASNGGGNNCRADADYNSVGSKLMSSPFLDDFDSAAESPKRRSVLRRMSGLWKKSPK